MRTLSSMLKDKYLFGISLNNVLVFVIACGVVVGIIIGIMVGASLVSAM